MHLRCPHCHNPIEIADAAPAGEITCVGCGSSFQVGNFSAATATFTAPANKRIGKFEVLGVLGQGAFGTVVKARDTELDRSVAIKIPRAGNVGSGRTTSIASCAGPPVAGLRFPSIVSIHEVGIDNDNGSPYLVCDLVEGVTLADLLTGRRLTFQESAKLLANVADALAYAHSLGVVHRDVKPSNVMIRPDGYPCVMDFGLAKRAAGRNHHDHRRPDPRHPRLHEPRTGPRRRPQGRWPQRRLQPRRDPLSTVDGELPFRGNKAMLLHQVLHEEPLRPRALNDKIPRDLDTIALKSNGEGAGAALCKRERDGGRFAAAGWRGSRSSRSPWDRRNACGDGASASRRLRA